MFNISPFFYIHKQVYLKSGFTSALQMSSARNFRLVFCGQFGCLIQEIWTNIPDTYSKMMME